MSEKLVKTDYVSLPNILADKELVKELLLEDCTPKNLADEINCLMGEKGQNMVQEFASLHHTIRKGADDQAANAVINLIRDKNKQ